MDDELAQVTEFRNRFVDWSNLVVPYTGGRYARPADDETRERIQREQSWLMVEFGRLHEPLHRHGTGQMATPMFGIESQDVLRDAIAGMGGTNRGALLQMAVQFLDMTVGRLQADAAKPQKAKPAPAPSNEAPGRPHWLRRAGIAAALATILVAMLAAVGVGLGIGLLHSASLALTPLLRSAVG